MSPMLPRIRKALLAFALALTFVGLAGVVAAPKAEAQAIYVGGPFVAYHGPVYWWWPVWPNAFTWPVYIPQPRYAAISYGEESGRIGVSYGQWSPQDSAVAAQRFCAADDCRGLVWVGEGCASLSRASDGQYGFAYSSQGYEARNLSIRYCRQSGGVDCRVAAETCSNGFGRIYP